MNKIEIEARTIAAANILVDAKTTAPASDRHVYAVCRLANMVADNPATIETLLKLQKKA